MRATREKKCLTARPASQQFATLILLQNHFFPLCPASVHDRPPSPAPPSWHHPKANAFLGTSLPPAARRLCSGQGVFTSPGTFAAGESRNREHRNEETPRPAGLCPPARGTAGAGGALSRQGEENTAQPSTKAGSPALSEHQNCGTEVCLTRNEMFHLVCLLFPWLPSGGGRFPFAFRFIFRLQSEKRGGFILSLPRNGQRLSAPRRKQEYWIRLLTLSLFLKEKKKTLFFSASTVCPGAQILLGPQISYPVCLHSQFVRKAASS